MGGRGSGAGGDVIDQCDRWHCVMQAYVGTAGRDSERDSERAKCAMGGRREEESDGVGSERL